MPCGRWPIYRSNQSDSRDPLLLNYNLERRHALTGNPHDLPWSRSRLVRCCDWSGAKKNATQPSRVLGVIQCFGRVGLRQSTRPLPTDTEQRSGKSNEQQEASRRFRNGFYRQCLPNWIQISTDCVS